MKLSKAQADAIRDETANMVKLTAGVLVRGAAGADIEAASRVEAMADEIARAVREGFITPEEVQYLIFNKGTRRQRREALAKFRKGKKGWK